MTKTKILIVEDDEITALNLSISLQKQEYTIVGTFDNIFDAKVNIPNLSPDLILIDISLQTPNDGLKLAREVREEYDMPFIYLTSHSDNETIDEAKVTEPYGYIIKPFNPASLHASIQMALFKFSQEKQARINLIHPDERQETLQAMLESKQEEGTTHVCFGKGYYFDTHLGQTFYKGDKIKLTKKENLFLKLLVAQMPKVISFDESLHYVWNENSATQNSVRTLVWRLRSKLPTEIIENASGTGYFINN